MSIDRNAVNFESLEDGALSSHTSSPKSSKAAGFGKKKGEQGPGIKMKKGGKGPSAKVSKATKTNGRFGSKGMK